MAKQPSSSSNSLRGTRRILNHFMLLLYPEINLKDEDLSQVILSIKSSREFKISDIFPCFPEINSHGRANYDFVSNDFKNWVQEKKKKKNKGSVKIKNEITAMENKQRSVCFKTEQLGGDDIINSTSTKPLSNLSHVTEKVAVKVEEELSCIPIPSAKANLFLHPDTSSHACSELNSHPPASGISFGKMNNINKEIHLTENNHANNISNSINESLHDSNENEIHSNNKDDTSKSFDIKSHDKDSSNSLSTNIKCSSAPNLLPLTPPLPYTLEQEIEFQSFLPGYRGAWFRAITKDYVIELLPKTDNMMYKYLIKYLNYDDPDEWIWLYENKDDRYLHCPRKKKLKRILENTRNKNKRNNKDIEKSINEENNNAIRTDDSDEDGNDDNLMNMSSKFELMIRPKPPKQIKMHQYLLALRQYKEKNQVRVKEMEGDVHVDAHANANEDSLIDKKNCSNHDVESNADVESVIVVRNEWKEGDWVDWYNKGAYWTARIVRKNETTALLQAPHVPEGEFNGNVWKAKLKNLRASVGYKNGEWFLTHINVSDPCGKIKNLPKIIFSNPNQFLKKKRNTSRKKRVNLNFAILQF